MSVQPLPSRIRHISSHTLDRYADHINAAHNRRTARQAIQRLIACSRLATDVQLKIWRVRIDCEATYYYSESTAGRFLLIVKRGVVVTLRKLETR